MFKQVIFTGAALGLGCILAIGLGEIILRVIYRQPLYAFEQHLFAHSDDFGYYLTPRQKKRHAQPEYDYTIQSNSFGFRGPEPQFNADWRVLILGDSVAMGQGVAEGKNLTSLSQSQLDPEKRKLDIFNTAISGYGSMNHLNVLRKMAPLYKPQLVICMFYWNDIGMDQSLQVQNGYLVLNTNPHWTRRVREWMNNHSKLYCFVKRGLYNLKNKEEELLRGAHSSFAPSDLEKTVGYFKQMKQVSENNGAQFVVTLLPLGGIYEGEEKFQESKAVLTGLLKLNQIEYVDWMKIDAEIPRDQLIFPIDHHWNEAGHIYFSQKLSELIQGRLTL